MTKSLDTIAVGSCYIDINVENFPFGSTGIPCETELIGEQYEAVPGGSALNFCRLLGELGSRTAFIGMAGNDLPGDVLERLLEQHNVQSALSRRPDLLTNIGFNVTSPQGEHIMLVAGTANAALDPAAVIPKLGEVLPETKTLYMGGCFKLKALAPAFREIADLTDQHAVKLVVDHGRVPEGTSKEMFEAVQRLVLRAGYYLPSREEFCKLWSVANIDEGLHKLRAQAPNLVVIVKDGANGAFYWADGEIRQAEAQKVEKVINVTGAGDSFNAGVIAALTKNRSLADAVAYATKVAAAKIKGEKLPHG